MPTYNLGTLTIVDHKVDKITDALGIPELRFEDLYDLGRKAWEECDVISEGIEYLAQRVSGSEFALALTFFGRRWEEAKQEQAEEEEESKTDQKSGLRQ